MDTAERLAGAGAWTVRPGALTREMCRRSIEAMVEGAPRSGGVLRRGEEVADVRIRSCFEHVPDPAIAGAVTAALWAAAGDLLADRVPMHRLDGPKFCSYPAGGYFRAHRDSSADPLDPPVVRGRVISLSCVLNDGDDAGGLPVFDGGALVLHVPEAGGAVVPVNLQPSAGSVVAFRSDLLHEVRPIRSGTRYAAVAWLFAF